MRIVVQRVTQAQVEVAGARIAAIEHGLLLLVGVGQRDTEATSVALADKIARLRIFEDDAGKMNLSALDIGGAALVVSQFTLLADTSRGRRPSFVDAAPPAIAAPLVDRFAGALRDLGLHVAQGQFGAHMQVSLANDGPVTIVIEG
ncbi:MAG TPA: D-aminoacyl-tRNA deacylase [Ktedonobacterales bacterium]|nr:D-aminoacyl-tRNA deacylase [Ktedonobacterales bacterium]